MKLKILNENNAPIINTPFIQNNRFFVNGSWDYDAINAFITSNPDISKYTPEEREAYEKYVTRHKLFKRVKPNSFADKHPYLATAGSIGASGIGGAAIGYCGAKYLLPYLRSLGS